MRQILILLTLCSALHADDGLAGSIGVLDTRTVEIQTRERFAVKQQTLEAVGPQFIVGGEWTTTVRFFNRGTRSIPVTNFYFLDNTGSPLMVTFQTVTTNFQGQMVKGDPVTGVGATVTLQPGIGIEGNFLSTAATAQYGHILLDACGASLGCSTAGLYGEVILKNRNSTRPDFESVFPFEQPASLQYIPFDHRDGFTTTLYLVSPLSASTVTLDFRNLADRSIRTLTIPMLQSESKILSLHALAPETIGTLGTLVINSGTAFVVPTALRINPTNSFTPIRAFVPGN